MVSVVFIGLLFNTVSDFQLQWKSDDEFVGAAAVDTFCYVAHMFSSLDFEGTYFENVGISR